MDIKRYDIYPAHGMEIDVEESIDGHWCKYEDIEVVLQVLKSNIMDLQRESTQLRSEISTLKSLANNKP